MTASKYAHALRDKQRAHGVHSHKSRVDYRKNAGVKGRKRA